MLVEEEEEGAEVLRTGADGATVGEEDGGGDKGEVMEGEEDEVAVVSTCGGCGDIGEDNEVPSIETSPSGSSSSIC